MTLSGLPFWPALSGLLAIPAGCFDAGGDINGYATMLDREIERPTPDFASTLGYRGFVTNTGGATIYNFFNSSDYALATGPLDAWEGNQTLNKPDPLDVLTSVVPDTAYDFDAVTGGVPINQRGRLLDISNLTIKRFVSTPYESMSFVARSRSKATGAIGGVGGIVEFNVNIGPGSGTNLRAVRSDHSGEFARPMQQLQPFYQTLFDIVK